MKKRIVLLTLILCILTSLGNLYPAFAATVTAAPTSATVLIDGKQVSFTAFNIGGANYFKLRDLAMAFRDSAKCFEVSWNNDTHTIELLPNKKYTPIGGELAVESQAGARTAQVSAHKITMDGSILSFEAYTIGGANFFKLRDIVQIFGIEVLWDDASNTISLHTGMQATPDEKLLTYGDETVFLIGADKDARYAGEGLGAVVSKSGDILTSFDVVKRSTSMNATYKKDGKTYVVTGVRGYDIDRNIALLTSEIKTDTPLSIGDPSEMKKEAALRAIVRDENKESAIVSGSIISLTGAAGNTFIRGWTTTLKLTEKNWGAPVMNQAGDVIGVAFTRYDNSTEIGVVTPVEQISDWLSKVETMTLQEMRKECFPSADTVEVQDLAARLSVGRNSFKIKNRDILIDKMYIIESEQKPKTLLYLIRLSSSKQLQEAMASGDAELMQGVRSYCKGLMEAASEYFPDYEQYGVLADMYKSRYQVVNNYTGFLWELTNIVAPDNFNVGPVYYFEKTDEKGMVVN